MVQAIWYRGMSRDIVSQAEVLRQHFGREVSRDDSRSGQAVRLHHRAVAIVKIVTNGWGQLFVVQCALCVGAIGVLLFRTRKELAADEGPVASAQATRPTDRATE